MDFGDLIPGYFKKASNMFFAEKSNLPVLCLVYVNLSLTFSKEFERCLYDNIDIIISKYEAGFRKAHGGQYLLIQETYLF